MTIENKFDNLKQNEYISKKQNATIGTRNRKFQ